jgi:hypothetical protein
MDFGEQVAAGDADAARDLIAGYQTAFDAATAVLPDHPDEAPVQAWLLRVRARFYPPTDKGHR